MVSIMWQLVEGRDKFIKIFQYFAKLLAWFHLRKNTELSITYLEVSERTRAARQMFRLLKSLFEVKRIQLIANSSSDRFSRIANITSRACYCLHYLFENVYIIAKACNFQKFWP